MRPNNTQAVFDATAATYDRDRMKLIPGHEAFYAATLELIPQDAKLIIDLGAGSGLFSAMLHAAFPNAHLHLIDFSEPMLALARQRLGPSEGPAPRLTYTLADYTTTTLPANCDAIVSALSIHHLDDDIKQAILPRILTALHPGGVFINADHIAGPTPELEHEYQQRWLATIRANGATDQQISDSLYRQQEDRRTPVDAQLTWLRAAGFAQVDCWYKASSFAVLTGTRP
ncbi:methyltransferase domain-containing protein [Granulicella sp. 5B5]|uniref:class I SAM-dependent methyltransferase n=1 Tax=Granulicella sp. 5B5 TaxID=1617967 RepID=UPI0015F54127|nr:class I SAM-dependent methyltransferase [Granulicella sp. 5B5]QMV18281.1 methyltransferase domain-containing protein [Granulicella sp. 5B5]